MRSNAARREAMKPKQPANKAVSATDQLFAAEAAKAAEADADPKASETIPPESPIGDYTRELQQEYEEQQEEGKLELGE
jgi:hypothetical protein